MNIQKILLIAAGFFIFLAGTKVFAANVSPTPTNPQTTIDEKLNKDLQTVIASSVAQMHLVEKKGYIGTVTDNSETSITITDLNNTTNAIDVDELTKFSSPTSEANFGISDITKGTTIGVIGLYNKDSQRLLARFVDVLDLPTIVTGGILTIDSTNYTFTIATSGNNTQNIDVEDITKTNSYTQIGGMVKSGFSHLTVGERVQIVGYPDVKNSKLLVASRILLFPDLPIDPKITLINPSDIAPISTGSGNKLQPITK